MEWNPASLTQSTQGHFVSNGIPAPHHHHSVQLQHRAVNSLFSEAGIDEVGCDGRSNTPKTSSPMGLQSDYGEDPEENEKHQDLLVFGYGCKIFRDYERAQWIDDQKHMIPWMGNGELLIDRYDCRGALMDVARYEPGSGYDNSLDADESIDLNSSYEQEQLLEKELDEERYKDLNEDVDYDERAYDKADTRRLSLGENGLPAGTGGNHDNRHYAAFQYNYNEQNHDICIGPEPKKVVEEDAPYEKPPGLYIPEEIILPSSTKVHAIIEKTAKFIASQGNQMEIILKTKQASNPLFDFLNHGGNLNQYYKFLVHAIRSGIYRPPSSDDDMTSSEAANQSISSEYSGSEEDSEHTYLHPSLFRTSIASTVSALSSVDFSAASSSSRHNAYSMLVSKIKGTDSPDPTAQQPQAPPPPNQDAYSGFSYPSSSQPAPVHPKPHKKLPSTQDQLIIEKMASYVTKNGANFEEQVLIKNKSDPRFGFLNPSHEYHWYYLNCKERYKAECNAVVASREFVHYTGRPAHTSTRSTNVTKVVTSIQTKSIPPTVIAPSIKKSAIAAELAELKRKSSGLALKKETLKEKNTGTVVAAEHVFTQANLVHSKDKEKSVIRFSSSLSFNSIAPSNSAEEEPKVGGTAPVQKEPERIAVVEKHEKKDDVKDKPVEEKLKVEPEKVVRSMTAVIVPSVETEEEEEGEIKENDDGSDSDLFLLDEGGGNSTPASEDDEARERRRMERKRKAVLFLQKLKMSKMDNNTTKTQQSSASSNKTGNQSSVVPTNRSIPAGTSLGDLLHQRKQSSEELPVSNERVLNTVPPEITISDSDDNIRFLGQKSGSGNNDGSRSSSLSRRSTRSKSRDRTASSSRTSRKRRKRRRSRSYSSSRSPSRSDSSSSYDSDTRSSHTKKKSSKKKRKKKKKKYEKSSRSSHKSKRR